MKSLKIKNARLCKNIINLFIVLIVLIPFFPLALSFLKIEVRAWICFFLLIVVIFILIKGFKYAFSAEIVLKIIESKNKARTKFNLPNGITKEKIESNIKNIGKPVEHTMVFPQPENLQFCFKNSFTDSVKGFESVVSFYSTKNLNVDLYRNILNSANNNFKNLKGIKSPLSFVVQQKKVPLKRINIVVICADFIEENFTKNLFETLCKEDKDGIDESVLPCVIDFSSKTVVFNSEALPEMFSIPCARNKGIKLIKSKIFNNKLNLKNQNYVDFKVEGIDIEQTLWDFLKSQKDEFKSVEKKNKKIFENMKNGEVVFDDDILYVKLEERGVSLLVEKDEEIKKAFIDSFCFWDYPKTNQISKNTIAQIQKIASSYFYGEGYTVEFLSIEE